MEHLYPLSFLLLTAMPASAISVTGLMVQHSACGAPNGAIEIHVTGGSPPFTFLWSNGATTGNISGLLPGSYSVTVTDANNEEATGNWTIVNGPLDGGSWSAQDGHASCTGSLAGQVQVIEWGINGTPPYSYDPPPDGFDPQGDPYFVFQSMLPGSEVQIMVTDANGCTGTLTEYIVAPQLNGGPIMQVINIQGSCSNGAGGAATITNVNDGSFWTGPDWMLLDADNNYVMGSNGAANTMPFTGLAPGDYVFVRDWDPMGWYMAWPCDGNPYDRIGFTIPDLGTVCGQLNGRVFIDSDQDCAQDAGEAGVPYQVLEILPGPVHTITGSDGRYAIDLPDGAYTLGQTDPTLVQLCPASTPVPFTIATNPVTIDLADSSTVPLDLAVELASNAMRPGFAGTFWGRVRNLSPQLSGPVTITFALDNALTYVDAAPTPTSIAGNTITWELSPFTAFHAVNLAVSVQVPVGTPLGMALTSTLTVQNTLPEATPANNSATRNNVVTGSYDPNDKTAHTSTGASETHFFIDQDEWIDYTIRFQNTGTDTAFTVVITDTLSAALDLSTFQQGTASHPFSVAIKPDKTIEWTFANILLPDSGTNEAASHGLVSFRIRPASPVLAGTAIENIANIYFDFNEPVITEPSVLVAEFSTSSNESQGHELLLAPNPVADQLFVRNLTGKMMGGEMRVIGPDGRMIIIARITDERMALDLSKLAAGHYVLQVRGTDQRMHHEKFVICR